MKASAIAFLVAITTASPSFAAYQFRAVPSIVQADGFGASVAANETVIAVGAPLDDTKGINSGAVYLFNAATGTL